MLTPSVRQFCQSLLSGGLALCLAVGCTSNPNGLRSFKISKITVDRVQEKSPSHEVAVSEIAVSADEESEHSDEAPQPVVRYRHGESDERSVVVATATDESDDDRLTTASSEFTADELQESIIGRRVARRVLPNSDSASDPVEVAPAPAAAPEPLVVSVENDEHGRSSIRFEVPRELPGSEAPVLRAPEIDQSLSLDERKALIEPLYPKLPPMLPGADEDETQPLWSLMELQTTAWDNHPALMQAAAQIEVARGQMIQSGLHPNPLVGWEQDTIGPGIQGYKGPYMNQRIVTGGKLKLQRSAAAMEYDNAQIAYQKMRIDIATGVRSAYFDLLVAKKRREMQRALVRFTDEILRAQVDLVAGGQAAPYEPLQLQVFSMQARNAVINANNGVIASGRRLGAAIGILEQQHFRVAGEADETPSEVDYNRAAAYILENHTELRSVRNQIVQSQYLSRLEYIRPRIPDVDFYGTYQHAYGVPPFVNSYNFQVGAPLPIWDRNQGNILATQSSIINRERAYAATQNDLSGKVAEILGRYDTARAVAVNYRHQILPDQVRTYRGVYSRYRAGQEVNFGDVIVAQQTLSLAVTEYGNVLDQLWQSYVELADVLQLEDLNLIPAWFGEM